MIMSAQTDKIFAAFVKAQALLGSVHKDARNPHFKSTYATLENVIDAAKPVLTSEGLAFMQHCGPRDATGVTVTTLLVHTSGQYIGDALTLPMVKADPQAAGSAITYARRYALMSMLGLPATDDDAEEATRPPPAPARPAEPRTQPPTEAYKKALSYVQGATTRDALETVWAENSGKFRTYFDDENFQSLEASYQRLREELPAKKEAA